jgi:hypothetical protein
MDSARFESVGTSAVPLRESLLAAALSMSRHPQDHGWRQLYADIAEILATDPEPLLDLARNVPRIDDLAPAYVVGLLAISLQQAWDRSGSGSDPVARRLPQGEIAPLAAHLGPTIGFTLAQHRNSFTGVRRFLVPQVLLARHFARQQPADINFLDIGTGLGLLPRQLDSPACFDRFTADLTWPRTAPDFTRIGLSSRFGMELSPLPDLDWVRRCYGPSPYYDHMFEEILETLKIPEVQDASFTPVDRDACDVSALAEFISANSIRAVTAVYSLYQYSAEIRREIDRAISGSLPEGGIFINIEPHPTLGQPGCIVHIWLPGKRDRLTVCSVSDGHFRGRVIAGEDYDKFWG